MLRFSPNPNRAHLIPWQEWSDDAFRAARAANKPVMLFLAAFWCRYCQRMDEEAFSETENIALLNAYFLPLRIEYAQRPDVDARYNLNGWPTIAFLSPDGQLLAAVNYLPTDQFKELLINVYMSYQERKDELPAVAHDTEELSHEPARQLDDSRLATNLSEIADTIMELADRTHGGYDRGQKFIHPQVNEFMLARYEATKGQQYLDQVCLTLECMRAGAIYDHDGGAYFRTSSGADWSHPHREKLLVEEAGMLANCLVVFRISRRAEFRRMAEEIIQYLNAKLFDPASGTFFGCEDFLRNENPLAAGGEFFTIIDRCIYTDANAIVSAAYLDAAVLLDNPQYRETALTALEFLWRHCRSDSSGVFHYYDGAPNVPGLLQDQAQMGIALVRAHEATGDGVYLDRGRQVAAFILTELKNPVGGFYDIRADDSAALKLRLTLIEQNGAAASFFLALAQTTGKESYRDAALWAFQHFTGDFQEYGIHAAALGQALQKYLLPHTATKKYE